MTNQQIAENLLVAYRKVLEQSVYYDEDFYEHRALAAALRALVSECETWEDGTYMVKSNDILEIAKELEEK